MLEGLLTLPILVPVLFWAGYHYYKDRHLPEPPGNLLVCFALGIAANLLSVLMYRGLGPLGLRYDAVELADGNPAALVAYALLAIGPIEEFAKLLPFLLVALRFRAFDERLDGVIYASFIALGYAAAENVHYLEFLAPLEAFGRGFAGPVVHMLFASIWGYWIADARLSGRPVLPAAVAGFLIASGLHGVYDAIVLANPAQALPIAAALIAAIWIWRLKLIRALHLRAGHGEIPPAARPEGGPRPPG